MTDERENDECPFCGETKNTITRYKRDRFKYGEGVSAPILSAIVPVRKCKSCGQEWTDYIAEDLRERAVQRHLDKIRDRSE